MKSVLISLLMMLLLVQTFSNWMWVLEYNLNKTFIAQNLCLNKAKPQLKCSGKCQLMKQLAATQEEEKSSSTTTKIQIADVLMNSNWTSYSLPPSVATIKMQYPTLVINYHPSPASSFFHPPSYA